MSKSKRLTYGDGQPMTGMDELRAIVSMLDDNREDFNSRFKLEELVEIARAWRASGWDIYPDSWSKRQIVEALQGIPPQWDQDEKPIYKD